MEQVEFTNRQFVNPDEIRNLADWAGVSEWAAAEYLEAAWEGQRIMSRQFALGIARIAP